MSRFNERDPFVQLVFWSFLVGTIGFFISMVVLNIYLPDISTPLVVPFFMAFFLGTLVLLWEAAKNHYRIGVAGLLFAFVLFPGVAWLEIVFFGATGKAAAYIPILPAIIALKFFSVVHKRFKNARSEIKKS